LQGVELAGSRKIEMWWQCGRCGTKNLGRDKVCTSCGDPKDPSERFQMPGDTARAPTVTDPSMLRKAHAGPDWACGRCGANVSALHPDCTQCGAPKPRLASPSPQVQARRVGGLLAGLGMSFATALSIFVLVPVALILGGLSCCVGTVWLAGRPVDVAATVEHTSWERVVDVERYAVRAREGFTESRPQDAFEVESLGMRHHHDDKVVDHYKTETYTVQVPDGVDRVPFTERVKCGEDCVDLPEDCHETCKPDDNGFATCKTKCTGGGRRCTTRYCEEQRFREVPRTRPEVRTREVPVYRKVPVEREFFSWRVWAWAHQRAVVAKGEDSAPTWPSDEEVALGKGLAPGEDERERRRERYEVQLLGANGERYPVEVKTEAQFARFPLGSAHVVRLRGGQVEIDPQQP
jgi:hypothetical protein